jgi:hypothetical protein
MESRPHTFSPTPPEAWRLRETQCMSYVASKLPSMDVLKKLAARLPERNPTMAGKRLQIDVGTTQLMVSRVEGVGANKGSTAVLLELPRTFDEPGLLEVWGRTGKILVKSVLAFLETLPEDFPDVDPAYWSSLDAVAAQLDDLRIERVVTRHTNAHLVVRQSRDAVVVVSVYASATACRSPSTLHERSKSNSSWLSSLPRVSPGMSG